MDDLPYIHTDILSDNWIDHQFPKWARPYARLVRLDRPIGTWLLLLPCWWSLALAGETIPNLWYMFLFGIGAIVMRGAGCIINDIYDRDLDKQVERTNTRPLASGEIKLWQALVFLILLLLIGFGILLMFNKFTVWVGVASLSLVFTYPLAKRVTWWPQLVLGFAFNWGALMGWSAVNGTIGLSSLLLYTAGIFWTLGYDTIYAHQDKRDDVIIGIKSLALKLGDKSRLWITGFYTASLLLILLAGFANNIGSSFYVLLGAAALHATWNVASWKIDDSADCLTRFRNNRDFGIIVLVAIIIGKII